MTQLTKLDPQVIVASRWANRDSRSFSNDAFQALKLEIAHCGGNVQPIKVRPSGLGYEIVFGHRRHRACLELGLPVLAVVVDVDDRELWQQMERENRGRADLSPFEQGRHYRLALDAGLFPSVRRMAESIGVDQSQAGKVIRIADLPEAVLAAFGDPNEIQVNWSSALHSALQRDPDAVMSQAHSVNHGHETRPSAKAIFKKLVGRGGEERFLRNGTILENGTGTNVVITPRENGYLVEITGSDIALSALETTLQELLNVGRCGPRGRKTPAINHEKV